MTRWFLRALRGMTLDALFAVMEWRSRTMSTTDGTSVSSASASSTAWKSTVAGDVGDAPSSSERSEMPEHRIPLPPLSTMHMYQVRLGDRLALNEMIIDTCRDPDLAYWWRDHALYRRIGGVEVRA